MKSETCLFSGGFLLHNVANDNIELLWRRQLPDCSLLVQSSAWWLHSSTLDAVNGKGNDDDVCFLESCKKLAAAHTQLYLINQCHSDKKVKTAYKRIQTRSQLRGGEQSFARSKFVFNKFVQIFLTILTFSRNITLSLLIYNYKIGGRIVWQKKILFL